jgi:DNA-directed RNA polymerase subunit RPC12/RpoP
MAQKDSYQEFEAAELFCSRCQKLVPVRKKMLLVLSEGDQYDYVCSVCGQRVGGKLDKKEGNLGKLIL